MTYTQVIDYLFSQLPQYQKIAGKAYKPGLDRISQLCDILENPQDRLKIVHVAGTNGKGSTCSMLASILQESGYCTGLFTSPHLLDFRERIRINGRMISKEEVISFVIGYKAQFETIKASFFEWTTALALFSFARSEVDVVILETGMGGRLDSTNIVLPILSVITPIGLDHTQYLGISLEEITKEKGGIIKHNIPVVVAKSNKNVDWVLRELAEEKNASFYRATQLEKDYETDLIGSFQQENICTTLCSIEQLKAHFPNIDSSTTTTGLQNVNRNTGLRGRWEIIQKEPKVIADIGHNYDGVKAILGQLIKESFTTLYIVWGMTKEKEVERIVELLPENAQYYLSAPSIERALPVAELVCFFRGKEKVNCYESFAEAYSSALKDARQEDLILVGGSTFVVAEVISQF